MYYCVTLAHKKNPEIRTVFVSMSSQKLEVYRKNITTFTENNVGYAVVSKVQLTGPKTYEKYKANNMKKAVDCLKILYEREEAEKNRHLIKNLFAKIFA